MPIPLLLLYAVKQRFNSITKGSQQRTDHHHHVIVKKVKVGPNADVDTRAAPVLCPVRMTGDDLWTRLGLGCMHRMHFATRQVRSQLCSKLSIAGAPVPCPYLPYQIKYSWDLDLFSPPLLVLLFANFCPPPLLYPPPPRHPALALETRPRLRLDGCNGG